jgi:hypothetical protein
MTNRTVVGSVLAESERMLFACAAKGTIWYTAVMTKEQVKAVLDRVRTWPRERQEELAEIALEIEAELGSRTYHATPEELQAVDEAERSGVASEQEVEAAFRTFRGA